MVTTTSRGGPMLRASSTAFAGPFIYHFTRVSRNAKTGPMAVTTTSANTCLPGCSFRQSGCYAENGLLALHWRAVSAGARGGSFDELLAQIRTLPRRALWRHNQAGDLTPSAPGTIDVHLLSRLAMANRGRRGFTYTHYPPTRANRAAIRQANQLGFAVNLSAETLAQADGYAVLEVAPVVVVLPVGTTKPTRTPSGRPVIVCPSSVGNTDCLSCGICQQRDRSVIVGFPAHGARARHVERILLEGRPS
ncbi:hypothetical protein EJP69_14355 [Variovorax gossypii]|uniref:DUF7227 domain-containing protein n=1 Tax=Variovorax gossypii TaxID=1679495 RepID=A0A3S0J7D7_9BURK|nr:MULTISPECIES: hypothetical protein [Variovorax]MDR6522166.1 hypothetical protein [Variovorax paradoxus]RTQ35536.1 hypothetical protein EJP69_14355 [Variovorax gossypii]